LNSPDQKATASRRRGRGTKLAILVVLLVFLVLVHPGFTYLRSAGLLLRMENPTQPGIIGRFHTYIVDETLTELQTPAGAIRARLYVPRGAANAPAIVIVHGVHHLGIEEPRLVALARAISASGIRVLTPQLASLADYHVDSSSIALIGYSARAFSASLGQKVGVLGVSFGGGLSLLAAADPQFEPYIRCVVSVGAHDDLERVLQFFMSNRIARPDGTMLRMQAHEYGPLVLIYSHVEDFFPAAEVNAARETLRLLLWEDVNESRKRAELLSPGSRQKMELLYANHMEALAGEMAQSIANHREEMSPVSPHGHLQALRVPVLLLHRAADNVIPPSELLWLEQDVPRAELRAALASPAISHASMEGGPSMADNLRLVRFMAEMLELEGDRQAIPAGR
jgi:dienelactone hydrolase